jgi:hypothetical protein
MSLCLKFLFIFSIFITFSFVFKIILTDIILFLREDLFYLFLIKENINKESDHIHKKL